MEKSREDVLSLLFREFYEALVRVAHFIYTNEAPELSLYGAMKRLMQDKVRLSQGRNILQRAGNHDVSLSLTFFFSFY